ncbi:MAG: alpha/beta hydrolase [Clostridia bacterium]|nr:alpha/beta hydrolase [Clostridia bacterium]
MLFEKKIIGLYKQKLFSRCDDMGLARYFTHKDFPGLEAEPFSFKEMVCGNTLRGNFYAYPDYREDKIVVFDHGMGGGHLSYMREIERLCRAGYRVYSYDHTGCMTSEGENTGGFGRSVTDLLSCIEALDLKFDKKMPFSLIGHSWGAYSVMCCARGGAPIESVVAISGFSSVRRMADQLFPGIMRGYANKVMEIEEKANQLAAICDAADTLTFYKGQALIIHSADDKVVSARKHFDYIKKTVEDYNDRELGYESYVRFMLVDGKGHNPNYTEDAVKYLAHYVKTLNKRLKEGTLGTEKEREEFVASFDWMRMTEQDEAVWEEILTVLG